MCLTCGCNQPNNRHNDLRNITLDDVRDAGNYSGMNLPNTIYTLFKTLLCSYKMIRKGKKDFKPDEKCEM